MNTFVFSKLPDAHNRFVPSALEYSKKIAAKRLYDLLVARRPRQLLNADIASTQDLAVHSASNRPRS